MTEPVIVPHPNTIRGPIESDFNGQRDQTEKGYIAAKAQMEIDYHASLAEIETNKQAALVAAGLNPDGGTPSDYPNSVPDALSPPVNIQPGHIENQTEPENPPKPGDMVSLAGSTWSGNPQPEYTYQWFRHTDEGGNVGILDNNDEEINSQLYVVREDDVGATLHCRTTAANSSGNTAVDSDPSDVVAQISAPVNTDLPEVTGTAQVGQELTSSNGSWSGTVDSYAYHWYRHWETPSPGGEWIDATDSTYTLTSDDLDRTIQCRVTATNDGGSTGANSAFTDPVIAE